MVAASAAEMKIAAKLLEAGQLKRGDLADHAVEASVCGMSLVEVLLARDVISDTDVARAYADLYGLRFLDLTRRKPSTAWLLTLPENIARRKECVVFNEVNGQLVVVVADPGDPSVRAAVERRFERPIQYVVSPRYQIFDTMDEVYGEARKRGARLADIIPVASATRTMSATGLNMVEQLDSIVDEAVDRRASDIHLEPEKDRVRVRVRIDGRLVESRAYPLEAAAALVSRVKVMATLDITEKRKPQDGRFTATSFEQNIDVRVACIPVVVGDRHEQRITLRLLSMDRSSLTGEKLGMESEVRQSFERLILRPHGIILITGPTGSGKTTTLYAALQKINTLDKHIITVEDPVEYHIDGVNQVQVDSEYGVTFAAALRSIVRHDPDVIMVGEIRDEETAHLALEASLTGHLVFATLHTNSAVGACTRLLDMGCEPYLVSSAVIGVMAQRLVRRICTNCRKGLEANATERKLMDIPEERGPVEIFRGLGCARCLRSGYYDRLGVYEYVPFDSGLAGLVMEKAPTEALYKYAVSHGAITLRDDAITKVLHGRTTLEEAMRVTTGEL
ncbi:MAG: type II/IV secretion system protein [bacterium]|nr:type II/IV secretion system protein [bacterium]